MLVKIIKIIIALDIIKNSIVNKFNIFCLKKSEKLKISTIYKYI